MAKNRGEKRLLISCRLLESDLQLLDALIAL
jgi:hypothetical protein